MDIEAGDLISVFLVIAGVVVIVLGFFKNFGRQMQKIKIDKLGIDTELSTMALWLVLGFLLSAGGVYVYLQPDTVEGPMHMKLNIHFEPPEVNPKHPKFEVKAFIKTMKGEERGLPVRSRVMEGSLFVELEVPDKNSPFFLEFKTPKGIWKTDDHSVQEAAAKAYKVVSE